jgi:SOS response regulatory protein OraA/RecX
MKKLEAVEEARAIMTLGMDWGVFKWLMEKPKVRKIADRATEALNNAEDKVKATWSDELKLAYNYLATQEDEEAGKGKKAAKGKAAPKGIDPEVLATAKGVYEADEETETMRLDAEDTFDEGEKKLSVAMARDGARKALATYDLHEKAIRKAEAAAKKSG